MKRRKTNNLGHFLCLKSTARAKSSRKRLTRTKTIKTSDHSSLNYLHRLKRKEKRRRLAERATAFLKRSQRQVLEVKLSS